jgi:hypothetical protein
MGDTPYSALDRSLKRLALTILVSALVDIALAVVILVFPAWVASLMQLDSSQVLFLRGLSLVHWMLPWFCILAWMDTKRNIVVVAGAIGARIVYALYLGGWLVLGGYSYSWSILGGISLTFALVQYVFLRRSDFGFWEVLVRAGNPPGIRKQ